MFENSLSKKVRVAIERLKNFCPIDDNYYVCYSGGKDSDCIRILCQLANVPHELHYNLTTADAPESVQYIKSIPDIIIDKARYSDGTHKTMWNLIPKKKMPPTRLVRYCCSELKEHGGKGRMKVTGVRWAESLNRLNNSGVAQILGKPHSVKKFADDNYIQYDVNQKGTVILNYDNSSSRRLTEHCYRTTNTMVNPIIDWTEGEVWEFLHHYGCESNPLYQCGFSRVGCIGCPLGGSRSQKFEFSLYPKIKNNYIRAFDTMINVNPERRYYGWNSGYDVFAWWLGFDPNQLTFDGFDVSEV